MDFVGVCLLRLFAAPADDVAVLPVVDTIGIAVVLAVELLYPASRPTGVPLRVGECLLPLRGIGIEAGVGRLEACPLAAVQYAVVVRRRVVVAQGDTALLAAGDIPPLRVVAPRRLVLIIRYPRGKVVVAELEQSRHVILAAHHVQQQAAEVMPRLLEESAVVVVQVDDLADPAAHQLMERTGLQQGVADIADTCRGEADSHVVEVVDVVLQVFFRKVARHAGEVVQHTLPVDVAYLRELQQRGDVPVDFEKHDVRKAQRAVCHHALELHAQALCLVADFHQVAAPVDSRLRRAQHQFRHHPYLGHDFFRDHAVNAAVVVIFRTAVPDAEVGKGFMLQEFGGENSRRGHFRRVVVLEYVIDLLPVIAFGHGFRAEGGSHGRHRAGVVVHAVILRVDVLHDGKRQEYENKRQPFHGLKSDCCQRRVVPLNTRISSSASYTAEFATRRWCTNISLAISYLRCSHFASSSSSCTEFSIPAYSSSSSLGIPNRRLYLSRTYSISSMLFFPMSRTLTRSFPGHWHKSRMVLMSNSRHIRWIRVSYLLPKSSVFTLWLMSIFSIVCN